MYRRAADCVYTLSFDLSESAVVRFVEYYEYLPRPGDPGREYAYSVVIPMTEVDALTACLRRIVAGAPGGPPGEPVGIPVDDTPIDARGAALVRVGRELVAAGLLGAEPPWSGVPSQAGEAGPAGDGGPADEAGRAGGDGSGHRAGAGTPGELHGASRLASWLDAAAIPYERSEWSWHNSA